MPLLIWDNKYSVNNEELDNHHKALLDILNKLYDSCFDIDNKISLGPLLDDLVSYTNYHFTVEEQYMSKVGYKDIERHISLHRLFSERIHELRQKKDINDLDVTKELIVYLGNWLINHVMVEDNRYSI